MNHETAISIHDFRDFGLLCTWNGSCILSILAPSTFPFFYSPGLEGRRHHPQPPLLLPLPDLLEGVWIRSQGFPSPDFPRRVVCTSSRALT